MSEKSVRIVSVPLEQRITFPQKCLYCLGSASKKMEKDLSATYKTVEGTKEITHTFRMTLKDIPLCDTHAELSLTLWNINGFLIIISVVIGLISAIIFQVSTHWVEKFISGRGVAIVWGTAFLILILYGIGRVIAGLIKPEMRIMGATGGILGFSGRLELDETTKRPIAKILYFVNSNYADLFCKMNNLVYKNE